MQKVITDLLRWAIELSHVHAKQFDAESIVDIFVHHLEGKVVNHIPEFRAPSVELLEKGVKLFLGLDEGGTAGIHEFRQAPSTSVQLDVHESLLILLVAFDSEMKVLKLFSRLGCFF